jgi:hypothetical protein
VGVGAGAAPPQADDGAGQPQPAVAVDDRDDEQRATVADRPRRRGRAGRRGRRCGVLRPAAGGEQPQQRQTSRSAKRSG